MKKLSISSTAVERVRNLSGGNYWGRPTRDSVAQSMAEIFGRNFHAASSPRGLRKDLADALDGFEAKYGYFKLAD